MVPRNESTNVKKLLKCLAPLRFNILGCPSMAGEVFAYEESRLSFRIHAEEMAGNPLENIVWDNHVL